MIGRKLRGTVTSIPEPRHRGYIQVTVSGESWPHGIHNLRSGYDIPNGVEVGEEVELEYVRVGGGALWFAKRIGDKS